MFRKPNTPGRKTSWELQPGDLPPEWIAEKYGGFVDMENNAVFRYVKVFGELPNDCLEDLRLTLISPQEIIEGHVAALNPSGKSWFSREGINGSMLLVDTLISESFDCEPEKSSPMDSIVTLGFFVLPVGTYILLGWLGLDSDAGFMIVGFLAVIWIVAYVLLPPKRNRYNSRMEKLIKKLSAFLAACV